MKATIGPYLKYYNKPRPVDIQIDSQDLWSLDFTLALVIHPMLVAFRKEYMGGPFVDNEDVPDELHDVSRESEWDIDEHWFARWEYVLDEMIWTFALLADDDADWEYDTEKRARVQNGLRLFGKYYLNLWS